MKNIFLTLFLIFMVSLVTLSNSNVNAQLCKTRADCGSLCCWVNGFCGPCAKWLNQAIERMINFSIVITFNYNIFYLILKINFNLQMNNLIKAIIHLFMFIIFSFQLIFNYFTTFKNFNFKDRASIF